MMSVGEIHPARQPASIRDKPIQHIAPSLPGYGNSSSPPPTQTFAETIAKDISFLLESLHPSSQLPHNFQLYIGGGSFGTVVAQILYGASIDLFPWGRYVKGLLLLGTFPPLVQCARNGFNWPKFMPWPSYFSMGPPARFLPFRLMARLMKSVISKRIQTPASGEAMLRELIFDKMDTEEKEVFLKWRTRVGYEEGQLEKEIAEMNRKSVAVTWEGFMSMSEVLHSDWWGKQRTIEELDSNLKMGRPVLVVSASNDESTPPAWAEFTASVYPNAKLMRIHGTHISYMFHTEEIFREFFDLCQTFASEPKS